MLAQSILVTLVATAGLVAAAPSPFSSGRISGSVLHLAKRANTSSTEPTVSSSSYLQDLFSYETTQSAKACAVPLADLETCAKGTNQAMIAACACSTQTLGDLRTCASAISTTTTSATNATNVVQSYNNFVDLCQTEGLATVTGTIAAGESTSAVSRTSSSSVPSGSAAASSASSHPTYNAASTPTSTATVPALTVSPQASGVNANSAKTNAASNPTTVGGSIVALAGLFACSLLF
ncbi:uncharacterized protein JCM15063_006290 [Sporobolomyces koalae]|uniref:uncharacterized protein n=1 Tax=Sporobolomyces koalae TaxID=500713 RepID=UPI00317A6CC1